MIDRKKDKLVELAERHHNTLLLLDRIERAQRWRRFKRWCRRWWNWLLRRKNDDERPRRLPFSSPP